MYRIISLLVLNIFLVHGSSVETIKYCCNLGTSFAESGSECNDFRTPIPDIPPADQASCLRSVDVCCKKQFREAECNAGKADAKYGSSCSASEITGQYKRECCEACKLGIETGSSGPSSCSVNFEFGAPIDDAFLACCKEAAEEPTTPNSNIFSTTPSTTPESDLFAKMSKKSNDDPEVYDALPPLENLCDISEICAHICIPTGDTYRCDCNKGFTLMDDGVSCKPDRVVNNKKNPDRCDQNNPCEQICIDTGVAVKCSCKEGYTLQSDKRTCKDIDECVTGEYDCAPGEECVNAEGGYYCEYSDDPTDDGLSIFDKCPDGYKFNGEKMVCDDIDECEFGIMCQRPQICVNTVGSFRCEGEDIPQCPPGFQYKAAIDTCADIDECITGDNNCNRESQVCLNTKGNYTCIDKVSKRSCPAGFKKNPYTQLCEDIDECVESPEVCDPEEDCVNEESGYKCIPKRLSTSSTTQRIYVPVNSPKVYTPTTQRVYTSTTTTQKSTTSRTTPQTSRTPFVTSSTTASTPRVMTSCQAGLRFSPQLNQCVDIDECREDEYACASTENCYNTVGSFVCQCKVGYTKDFHTGACVDLNECQLGTHDCSTGHRCDNTVGSYICARLAGCGTGYTLNYANGICEDDDECALGTHNCNDLGSESVCRNTVGSYRCDLVKKVTRPPPTSVTNRYIPFIPYLPITSTTNYPIITGQLKNCLPGYRMNYLGQCEDINECESNPCRFGQKCLNFNGRYQCISTIQCKYGYELNESGDSCIDVNECTRGNHKCGPTQICKNGHGYYTCECPPGHHLARGSTVCEDIDECNAFYRVCPLQSRCINSIGSYRCDCKDGFKEQNKNCVDIDECKETAQLCEHNCVNTWGGYRCACKPGFTLNSDNRTCTDVDECVKFRDRKLCIGTCQNVPGSYTCRCPNGYKLGGDGRTCQDIDECEQNVCSRPDDICLNTRGSYKCFTLSCPQNYFRDPSHKSRCKRYQNACDYRDTYCLTLPDQYTSHYISFSSQLPVTNGPIPFFQIKGSHWRGSRVEFSMELGNVTCPYGVERITENNFRMIRMNQNGLQLVIIRPLHGPQEVQLIVKMSIFHSDIVTTHVVFYIYIVVSEYEF